jgi:hypothetical protein
MATMVNVNHAIQLDAQQRIVKAADVQTYIEFADLQAHGHSLIAQAEVDAEHIRQQAYEQGFAQGIAAADQHIAEQLMALTAERANFVRDMEKQLPTLVLSLVHRIVADFDDADKLASLTQQVLAKIKSAQRIIIRIHPSQVDDFTQALVTRIEQSALADCIEIEGDMDIALHQCHVEFDEGLYILDWQSVLQQIDAQMQTESTAASAVADTLH